MYNWPARCATGMNCMMMIKIFHSKPCYFGLNRWPNRVILVLVPSALLCIWTGVGHPCGTCTCVCVCVCACVHVCVWRGCSLVPRLLKRGFSSRHLTSSMMKYRYSSTEHDVYGSMASEFFYKEGGTSAMIFF